MDFHGADLVCPACRTDLEQRVDNLHCAACGRTFPVLLGIPDLRLWPDPYIGFAEDRAKGVRLAEACASLSFPDAVEHYYSITSKVPPFQARRFARSLMAATVRAEAQLEQWESLVKGSARGLLLEIGCGTAPLLQVATARYPAVVGVDIAFRWLVLAQKRLADAGLSLPLICACAEALPFRNARFARVVADSTLEHLRDQHLALQECARVMIGGASLFVATPNRFSIGPDPHTGMPAGSFMPAAVTGAYVRRKGGIPPVRQLLSARKLQALLRRTGFTDVQLALPDVPAAQRAAFGGATRALLTAYQQIRRTPPGRMLLERIGPMLLAVGRKPA